MPMSEDRIRELEACRALTPVPDDFDEFWACRMAEADAVELDYQIVPASGGSGAAVRPFGGCEYYDVWFTGMEGARVYAKYLVPAGACRATAGPDGAVPLVLQFHGYPGCTRSWAEYSSFVGMGCAVLAMDNPGQGGRSQDVGGFVGTTVSGHIIAGVDGGPQNLYYVRLYQDVRILCRIARELEGIDLARVFVNGNSQGGGMGLACCALNSDLVSRASILYPFLSDYRRVCQLGRDEIAYEGLRYYARWFDADGSRVDEVFRTLSYIDSTSFAHLVRCPVLFGTGLADVVCPPETQYAVYNALTCPKKHVLFPDFGHEEIQAYDDMIPGFYLGEVDFA